MRIFLSTCLSYLSYPIGLAQIMKDALLFFALFKLHLPLFQVQWQQALLNL